MNIHIKTKYLDEPATLEFRHYNDGSTLIVAFSLTGEPLATCTVAVVELPGEGYVFLKDWGENEGIPECLVKAGIVELTGKKVWAGFCEALEAKLLINVSAGQL